jgi:glycosyltransferase involved in cell wall biosynthesis
LPLPADHPEYGRVPYHRHPGRWVLNLALAQKAHADIEPKLLVQVPGAKRDFSTTIEGISVEFIAAPDRFRSASLYWFDARRLASRARTLAPAVVHAHGTEDAYGLAAQRTRLPYVITVQGMFFQINRVVSLPLFSRSRAVEIAERMCLRRARDIIAKSEYVADRLAYRFPNLSIHRIPNTLDPRILEIREDKQKNVIAFVGTIVPVKGLDLLCDALDVVRSNVPDVTLWIVGDYPQDPSAYEQRIKQRLRATLGDRVVFHGTLPNLNVARYVAIAAALVAPSREEMFGNQLIEALVVGTYGIVTAGTAMAENVERFGGGAIVPQQDPNALARAIITAITNPPHVPTSVIRKQICEYMGPEIVARRHYDLYSKLLSES